MIVFAEITIKRDIAQDIIHPAHIPLEVEAEAAYIRRLGDEGPSGTLLSDHQRGRVLLEDNLV